MRHVSRTHRVALDWLFDTINVDPKIQIKYVDTKNQLADILTKGNFTRDEWNHLLCLFNISHFSSAECSEVMSKRTQKDSGEETSHSRIETNDEFGLAIQRKGSERACLDCIGKSGETRYESQNVPLSSLNVQQTSTGRLVMGAGSSNYSEWNIDDKWSSLEWKSGAMWESRTERPVGGQESTQDTEICHR